MIWRLVVAPDSSAASHRVVAHVLLGHGERGALDQLLQTGLGHPHPLGGLDLVHRREIVRRQAGQGEPAATGRDRHLVAGLRHRDLAAVRERPHDLEQLARRDRGFPVLGIVDRLAGHHFHFQVGTRERQLAALDLDQQVGQDRQGLPPFDHVDHLRERFQEDFALQAEAHADPLL